jgi:hypothetical protein
MIGAISSNPTDATSDKPTRRSPALDAQLQTARNQLEDRVTCPSAKTSAGKVKIKQVSEKVADIELQIKQADKATQSSLRSLVDTYA